MRAPKSVFRAPIYVCVRPFMYACAQSVFSAPINVYMHFREIHPIHVRKFFNYVFYSSYCALSSTGVTPRSGQIILFAWSVPSCGVYKSGDAASCYLGGISGARTLNLPFEGNPSRSKYDPLPICRGIPACGWLQRRGGTWSPAGYGGCCGGGHGWRSHMPTWLRPPKSNTGSQRKIQRLRWLCWQQLWGYKVISLAKNN